MLTGADAESLVGYKYCLLYTYTRQMGTYDHFKYYMGWLELVRNNGLIISLYRCILWAVSRILKL